MRCDHSLLGGEWTKTPANYNPRLRDPIYAVFAMLEAVRLVEPDDGSRARADKDSSALVMYVPTILHDESPADLSLEDLESGLRLLH